MGGLATAGVGAFTALTKSAVSAAGELEQNLGGSEAVFQEYATFMQNTAKEAFSKMGLSQSEYLANANKMGSLLKGSGFGVKEAAETATAVMQRASDVASIMGIDVSAAMEAVTGAAKGNFTMMDNLGVAINDTTLKLYAQEKGLGELKTTQDKVSAAMQLFMEKTSDYANNYSKENATLAGSMTTLKAAWDNFLTGAGDAQQFSDALMGVVKSVGNTVQEVVPRLISGLGDMVAQLGPQIGPLIEELMPAVIDGAVALINGLTQAIPGLLPVLAEAGIQIVTGIGNAIAENGDAILAGFVTAFRSFEDTLTELFPGLQPFVNAIDNLIDYIGQLWEKLTPFIDGTLSFITDTLLPGIGNALEFLTENIDAVVAGAEILLSAFLAYETVEFIAGFIEGFTAAITALQAAEEGMTIAQYALNLAMSINPVGLIIAAIAALVAAFIYLWNNCDEFRQFWIDLWEGIKTAVSTAWDGIKTFFTETIPNAWENFKTMLSDGLNNIVEWFVSIPDKISTFFEELPYRLGVMIGELIAKIINFEVETDKKILEFISNAWTVIKDFFVNLPQNAAEFFSNLWTKIQDFASRAIAKTKEIVSNVVNFISELPGKIQAKITEIINRVIEFKNNMISKAKETATNFVTNLVDGIKSLPEKFKEAAHNVVEGFISGIKEKLQHAKDAIKDFATGIFDGFTSTLDIHSPSKKFEWASEMCIAGFEKPMEGYNPYSTLEDNINASAGSLTASFVGNAGNPAGVDYGTFADSVTKALAGMGIYMDTIQVGSMVAGPVNNALGRMTARRV